MAKSQKKTTLAVLRLVIGPVLGEEKRFAGVIGIPLGRFKKVCCGILRMTEDLAYRIANETGVSAKWLLAGDVNAPPYTEKGSVFNIATYIRRRIAREHGGGSAYVVDVLEGVELRYVVLPIRHR